jgi:hypothetical protein
MNGNGLVKDLYQNLDNYLIEQLAIKTLYDFNPAKTSILPKLKCLRIISCLSISADKIIQTIENSPNLTLLFLNGIGIWDL